LFLTLLSFNFIGYRFWYYYAQNRSDRLLQTSLDKATYDSNELITVNVPLSMPYINDQSDFERVDGEIEIDGKIYRFVKRKVSEGQLILLCLPDYSKTHLQEAGTDFFRAVNDLAGNTSSPKDNHGTSSFKSIQAEYEELWPDWHLPAVASDELTHRMIQVSFQLPSRGPTAPEHPPEAATA